MFHHPDPDQIPRAHIDPITDAATALALLSRVHAVPRRPETVVILLDGAHRGTSIITVDTTDEPDQVLEVVECFTCPELVASGLGAVIVSSDRTAAGRLEPADADRWFEMCDLTEQAGVELVEWFVFGAVVSCPRDLAGVPPRWRRPDARSA